MTYPTPYLEGLLLLSTIAPSTIVGIVQGGGRKHAIQERAEALYLITLAAPVLGVFTLVPAFVTPTIAVIILGGAGAALVIAIDVAAAALCLKVQRRSKKIRLSVIQPPKVLHRSLLIGVIALAEELIYRNGWLQLLLRWDIHPVWALTLTSLAYAVNHAHHGKVQVVLKFVSGSIYGILYLVTGFNVLTPLLAHLIQNLVSFRIVVRS